MLLAIDTSIGSSAAVVSPSGEVRSSLGVTDTMRHAEVIGELIRDALAAAGIGADGVTAVVAGMGPGPFTGLRIGIAAATAFALGRGVPLLRLVSHDAIAAEWALSGGEGQLTVSTDARRRELYWSRYLVEGGQARRVDGPGLVVPAELELHGEHVAATAVDAGRLGAIAAAGLRDGVEFPALSALYLRSPDVTPSAGPKRVTT
ncbi:tRNA (adenosine(37)-N6)-threonylcarbamoyltransferase complex dimerization subunit type 1 TsaB [Mycetocola reblochoni]|uniref:TsaB protein, required for threonylcarbamoyladenosine (T(6)A) formation in tRNA n=2 Tax=Mycetocola reblochoni TaxID=331618 RepID=A0A1R4I9U8_9MICO|nr:tRNA (adenosine(37)-N6)-threonylcarbamoyltransferase complex dimerization subunit type 1 TsaB [Mycetocola reblochoni]RLP69191.1 tRNA (adenosine(37)-N6)-threonylcarbamoyltransferase complex dimerization subunit type 1 TsaB [Mycetocola reblochoni]SJN16509.1 TsaB protein, required for threonylcarbamoyladenosine (t(6)A) formation in tRNA [Mycetocola reblochoni REB411]